MSKSDFVPAFAFHWLNRWYDFLLPWVFPAKKFRRKLIQLAAISPGEKVLDFGTGTAALIRTAVKMGVVADFYGADVDPEILEAGWKNLMEDGIHANLFLLHNPILPFEDHSFDTVISALVFHHLLPDEKTAAFSEISRLLKPSGKLIVGDFARPRYLSGRIAFYWVRIFDGLLGTKDHGNGNFPLKFSERSFHVCRELSAMRSPYGRLAFWEFRNR